MLKMEDRYFTLDEVAERFRVTRRTVNRWVEDGKLVAIRPYRNAGQVRVSESAVQDFVEKHRTDQQG